MDHNHGDNHSHALLEWRGRRSKTFIGFLCEAVALGMEYSLTFITLWLYLEDMIRTSHLKFYYSAISAAYLLSQVVCSIIFGRITDKYRNVKAMFLLGNTMVIVGNILYTIPLSPWFLFVGRLVSGGGGCLRCIMTGELARSYPAEELSSKFSLMGMAFGLGFIVGPGINFGFLKANFRVAGVHVRYANAPGFYLTIVFILIQLIAIVMVSNLSKEYDLKDHSVELETLPTCGEGSSLLTYPGNSSDSGNYSDIADKVDRHSGSTITSVVVKLFRNIDTVLVLIFSFFFMYCMVSFDLWQPLAVLKLNKWSVLEINVIILGYGIVSVLVLLVLTYFPMSDVAIVYFSMLCTLCISAINVIFVTFVHTANDTTLNIILWILYAFFFAIIVVMEEIFLIGVMAKMTCSSQQSFTESIRLGFSRTGALVALLSAASSFADLTVVCSSLAVVGLIGIALLCLRRRSLQNPQTLIK